MLGYAGFTVCAMALAVGAVTGGGGARIGGACGLLGLVAAVWAIVRGDRREHAEEHRPLATSVSEAMRWTGVSWFGVAAFVAIAFLASNDGSTALKAVAITAAAIGLGGTFVVIVRGSLRAEGVERELYLVSTSVAFVMTMVGIAIYALAESAFGAPKLSLWWVYTGGIVTWVVTSAIYKRRIS